MENEHYFYKFNKIKIGKKRKDKQKQNKRNDSEKLVGNIQC